MLLHAGVAAHAGPLDWLRGLFDDPAPSPQRIIGNIDDPVPLQPGKSVQLRIDANTPAAELPGGVSHYRRFTLPQALPAALVKVRVLTQGHDRSPRFTAFVPQLHLLDKHGYIRQSMPLRPLRLTIAPFRPAELRACMRVENLHSFLLAADTAKVGETYRYNARTRGGSYPDRGYYRPASVLNVYLVYADVGELSLRVIPVDKKHPRCTRWQG